MSAVVSCGVAGLLVRRGRGPMMVAALLLTVRVPFLIGLYGGIYKTIAALETSVKSGRPAPPGEVEWIASKAVVIALVGVLLTIPGYATALSGSLVRALGQPAETCSAAVEDGA